MTFVTHRYGAGMTGYEMSRRVKLGMECSVALGSRRTGHEAEMNNCCVMEGMNASATLWRSSETVGPVKQGECRASEDFLHSNNVR